MGRKSSVGGNEPPRTGKPGGSESNRKATSLNVGRILETHHQQQQQQGKLTVNSIASRKANSVSKISLLANKLDKIKMYNQEARIV